MSTMPMCVLQRTEDDGKSCFGIMTMPSGIVYQSVERPWKHNANNVSCIPPGDYICTVTFSNRFKKPLYVVKDVPRRAGIRIHSANYAEELQGCIALGVAKIIGGVAASRIAVDRMTNELAGKDFILRVIGVPGLKYD